MKHPRVVFKYFKKKRNANNQNSKLKKSPGNCFDSKEYMLSIFPVLFSFAFFLFLFVCLFVWLVGCQLVSSLDSLFVLFLFSFPFLITFVLFPAQSPLSLSPLTHVLKHKNQFVAPILWCSPAHQVISHTNKDLSVPHALNECKFPPF